MSAPSPDPVNPSEASPGPGNDTLLAALYGGHPDVKRLSDATDLLSRIGVPESLRRCDVDANTLLAWLDGMDPVLAFLLGMIICEQDAQAVNKMLMRFNRPEPQIQYSISV